MQDQVLDSPDVVLFTGQTSLDPGQLELHSLKDKLFGRKIEDVQADWGKVSRQVARMLDATTKERPAGFELDTVEISLGFTASGRLAFIAEAGVEASVGITLKRGASANPQQ